MKIFLLFIFLSASVFIWAHPIKSLQMEKPTFSDSLESKKMLAKRSAIRLKPNPSLKGSVKVISNLSSVLHFYIFDLEGTLVYQTVMKNREKRKVENLMKGVYTYDVFENDESIEEGKLVIK